MVTKRLRFAYNPTLSKFTFSNTDRVENHCFRLEKGCAWETIAMGTKTGLLESPLKVGQLRTTEGPLVPGKRKNRHWDSDHCLEPPTFQDQAQQPLLHEYRPRRTHRYNRDSGQVRAREVIWATEVSVQHNCTRRQGTVNAGASLVRSGPMQSVFSTSFDTLNSQLVLHNRRYPQSQKSGSFSEISMGDFSTFRADSGHKTAGYLFKQLGAPQVAETFASFSNVLETHHDFGIRILLAANGSAYYVHEGAKKFVKKLVSSAVVPDFGVQTTGWFIVGFHYVSPHHGPSSPQGLKLGYGVSIRVFLLRIFRTRRKFQDLSDEGYVHPFNHQSFRRLVGAIFNPLCLESELACVCVCNRILAEIAFDKNSLLRSFSEWSNLELEGEGAAVSSSSSTSKTDVGKGLKTAMAIKDEFTGDGLESPMPNHFLNSKRTFLPSLYVQEARFEEVDRLPHGAATDQNNSAGLSSTKGCHFDLVTGFECTRRPLDYTDWNKVPRNHVDKKAKKGRPVLYLNGYDQRAYVN
ncbi:hypothetical protein CLF_112891 [Clonorchis sinensis]|uniref:Uncharacterized protein n=1 Tax=Clonorchis sinensis TaxID=79923 RepID=H2KTA7_CLOSI|nr:hypothetical protein CLF_112891 [Clonorchis sinensis]